MAMFVQILLNGIIAAAMYALMAMAFNLMYGVSRFFHLALGGYAVVGGYVTFACFQHTSFPIWLAIILSCWISGFIGWVLDRSIFLHLRKRQASSLVQVVASLGLLLFLQAAVAMIFTSEYQSFPVSLANGTMELGGGVITLTQLEILAIACGCFVALWCWLNFSRYGRTIKAVSDDGEAAAMIGIHTEQVIGAVVFIASAIAGLAGVLTGFDTGLTPLMGLTLLLKGAIGGVIGGLGTISGAFLGSFMLGFIENFGVWFIASQWKDAIAFALLIIFLLMRPEGVISKR